MEIGRSGRTPQKLIAGRKQREAGVITGGAFEEMVRVRRRSGMTPGVSASAGSISGLEDSTTIPTLSVR